MNLYCEFGKPQRRLVSSYEELVRLINIYNGVANCYSTVYMFEELDESDNWRKKPDYNTAIIDRVFLDFDGDNAFENMKIVHEKLLKENIKHHVNFSGNGYHIFIYTEKNELKYKKLALARYAISLTDDQDMQVVGDIARLVRIPNTLHLGTKLYCINITHEDIMSGEKAIRKKAIRPHPNLEIMGEKLVNLAPFDYPEENNFETSDTGFSDGLELPPEIPGCVEHAMKSSNPGYYQRFLYFTYMRDLDFSMKSALEMVEKKWSVKKMRHCLKTERQPQNIWRNGIYFPNCKFIKNIGLCRNCMTEE